MDTIRTYESLISNVKYYIDIVISCNRMLENISGNKGQLGIFCVSVTGGEPQ